MKVANYPDVLQSVSVTAFKVIRWTSRSGEHEHYGTMRALGTETPPCALVFIDNLHVEPEAAIDLARPELIDWAIVVRPQEAGVLFGSESVYGVLLIGTKMARRR